MSDRPSAQAFAREVGEARRSSPAAFGGGMITGALGGLLGLGGAEFRLPLLIGTFRFAALQAVILNKAMSLVVVASALPFRAATVPFAAIAAHWPIIVNLLAAVCSAHGSGRGGRPGSRRRRFIASSLYCCSGSQSSSCSGMTPRQPRARHSRARRR